MKVNKWIKNSRFSWAGHHCILCGTEVGGNIDICEACKADIPRIEHPCSSCGVPLPKAAQSQCGQCQQRAPHYLQTYSFGHYGPPLDRLIQQVKFHRKLDIARVLGELMAEDIASKIEKIPDRIVPVPLYRRRLRQRGYNQAVELARPIADKLQIYLDLLSCLRYKDTSEQTGLNAKQRRTNIKDAFSVTQSLRNEHVVIFDDVMTTGTTVNELARSIMNAGALRVDVWVCARASL